MLCICVRPCHQLDLVSTSIHTDLKRGSAMRASPSACVCSPSHALYFASYEAAKQLYGGNQEGHHPLATAAAGATATFVNDGCMTPWDVVKQRMQVGGGGCVGVCGWQVASWGWELGAAPSTLLCEGIRSAHPLCPAYTPCRYRTRPTGAWRTACKPRGGRRGCEPFTSPTGQP